MSRPLKQGEDAISLDVQSLSRILRRIQADPKRPDDEKEQMTSHLKAVIRLLLVDGTRARKPLNKKNRAA